MEDIKHICYRPQVVEFVAVAKEFCDFAESVSQMERKDFLQRLQKFIPLIYLKGSLLPSFDGSEDGFTEDVVTEDDYNFVFNSIKTLLGEYDDYLEVFDDNMMFSETPIVNTISEKIADIYQDLKNFIESYKTGMAEVMDEALWHLNESFDMFWGKACVCVLRAIHQTLLKIDDDQ